MKPKLVILISGSGSNLQAFIDAIANKQLDAKIALVISNKPDVKGLERAQQAGIPTTVLAHQNFKSREAFDQELITQIDTHKPDAIILAGFMRILTEEFVQHYLGRLFNIHPSLLPKYPGLHTHQRAIENKDTEAGTTVHFVVPELDAGPAIIQAAIPVQDDDSADDLAKRVLQQEHQIYPLAVKWFLEKRLQLIHDKAAPHSTLSAELDAKPLPSSGFIYTG